MPQKKRGEKHQLNRERGTLWRKGIPTDSGNFRCTPLYTLWVQQGDSHGYGWWGCWKLSSQKPWGQASYGEKFSADVQAPYLVTSGPYLLFAWNSPSHFLLLPLNPSPLAPLHTSPSQCLTHNWHWKKTDNLLNVWTSTLDLYKANQGIKVHSIFCDSGQVTTSPCPCPLTCKVGVIVTTLPRCFGKNTRITIKGNR